MGGEVKRQRTRQGLKKRRTSGKRDALVFRGERAPKTESVGEGESRLQREQRGHRKEGQNKNEKGEGKRTRVKEEADREVREK